MTDTPKKDRAVRRPDCVTEIRMGNTVLVVSGFFKESSTETAAGDIEQKQRYCQALKEFYHSVKALCSIPDPAVVILIHAYEYTRARAQIEQITDNKPLKQDISESWGKYI